MDKKETKLINIRVPVDLLHEMTALREKEGVSVTFQFCKGAQLYLKTKGKFSK